MCPLSSGPLLSVKGDLSVAVDLMAETGSLSGDRSLGGDISLDVGERSVLAYIYRYSMSCWRAGSVRSSESSSNLASLLSDSHVCCNLL